MNTREKIRAEIDQFDEEQLVELYRHLRGSIEADTSNIVEMTAKVFGRRLRRLREASGIERVEDGAAKVGIGAVQVTQLETGRRMPSVPTLHGIVAAWGIDAAQLFAPVTEVELEADVADGHVEAGQGPLERLQKIVIDAPVDFSADLERSRHGS